MNKLEGIYFLKGSPAFNRQSAEMVFSDGLYSQTNNMATTMMYVEASDNSIENKASKYGYDMVYIVRIPKLFFKPPIVNGKLIEAPLPIWKKDANGFYLDNELVYGIYYAKDDTLVYNENYNEINNPVGLVFDQQQEDFFKKHNIEVMEKFSALRYNQNYNTLAAYDIDHNVWDKVLARYERHLNNNIIGK